MQPARTLRARLGDGKPVVGMLVSNHLWPEIVEIASDAGLDYIVIDQEHGPHSEETMAQTCALGRVAGYPVLIRPVSNDFRTVSKTMDLGPCGLVLAAVEDAGTMDGVRDAVWMPPRGKRRPGGLGNRWVKNYYRQTWKEGVEDHVIVIPQIETRTGLANVRAIAEHEVVTAVGIGPYDLMMAVGADLNHKHPAFVEARGKVRDTAAAVGKLFWDVGNTVLLAGDGGRFLCMGDPVGLLTKSLREQVEQTRKAAGVPG